MCFIILDDNMPKGSNKGQAVAKNKTKMLCEKTCSSSGSSCHALQLMYDGQMNICDRTCWDAILSKFTGSLSETQTQQLDRVYKCKVY